MITAETVRQAVQNIDKEKADRFNFKSFVLGLATGLTICCVLLIVLL